MAKSVSLELQEQFVRVYNYWKERHEQGEHVTWANVLEDLGFSCNSDRFLRDIRKAAEATYQCKFPSFNEAKSPRRYTKLPYGCAEYTYDKVVIPTCSDVHAWPKELAPPSDTFLVYLAVLEELAKDKDTPILIMINGDMFDGASISRFPRNRWEQKPSVKQELQACKDHTDEIEKRVEGHPNVRLVWVWGNHDERFDSRLANCVGEFEGVKGFSLVDVFPKWEFTQSALVNNCAYFVHDVHKGKHAAYNNVTDFGPNVHVFTGHTHRLLTRTRTFFAGQGKATETGTLCDINAPQFQYLKGNQPDWQPGFVVVNVDEDHCHEELVSVDRKAMWRGEDWL